jgi:hypothetical protein
MQASGSGAPLFCALAIALAFSACDRQPEPQPASESRTPQSSSSAAVNKNRHSPERPLHKDAPAKSEPPADTQITIQTACNHTDRAALPYSVTVFTPNASLFIYPHAQPVPLKTVPRGEALRVVDSSGEWFLVRFDRERYGYVHCASVKLTAMAGHPVTAEIPSLSSATSSPSLETPAGQADPGLPAAKTSLESSAVREAPRAQSITPDRGAAFEKKSNEAANSSGTPASLHDSPYASSDASKQRLSVTIIDRRDNATSYMYVVPGFWNSTSNTNVNCSSFGNTVNCGGSTNTTGFGTTPHPVSYSVRGATFSLQLPDGRIAVVNCDSKYALRGDYINRRSCRMPFVNNIQAEFSGDKAKLWWSVSIDNGKMQSETYKILAVLDRPFPRTTEVVRSQLVQPPPLPQPVQPAPRYFQPTAVPASPAVIESCIDGDFEGWEGETIFKLCNGQIWQQAEYAYTYEYAYRPDVIIYRTSSGYRLKVEDVSETVAVKRLK